MTVSTTYKFWLSRFVNLPADKEALKAVTLLVNGGRNGFTQRHLSRDVLKRKEGSLSEY